MQHNGYNETMAVTKTDRENGTGRDCIRYGTALCK